MENNNENNNQNKSLIDDPKTKIFLLLLIVLIIFFLMLKMISSFASSSNNAKEENNVQAKKENPKKINYEEKIPVVARNYFKDINIFQNPLMDEYGYFYKNDEVTKETIPSKVKLAITLYNLTKNLNRYNPINFTKQEIINEMEEIFNNDSEYTDENIKINCMNFTFENDIYKGTPFNCNQNVNEHIVTQLTSVKEEEDKVIIEEKMAYLAKEGDKINLYRTFEKNKNNLVETLKIRNFGEFLIDHYLKELYVYRWTLTKIDDNHYTFEKIEKIEDCSITLTC